MPDPTTTQAVLSTPCGGSLSDYQPSVLDQAVRLLDELSGASVRLLFHLGGLERCAKGLCCAKVRTLADRMGCSERTVRRRWAELQGAGLAEKIRRRCRSAWRGLTELGRAVLAVVRSGGELAVSAHLAAHKGEAEGQKINIPPAVGKSPRSADPRPRQPQPVNPADYQIPRGASALTAKSWAACAAWMASARSVSWARCRIAHRAFSGVVVALHRSREWAGFSRAMAAGGRFISAEELVRLAVEDAVHRGRDFGTVETATRYLGAVVLACVRERRLPGAAPTRRVRPARLSGGA